MSSTAPSSQRRARLLLAGRVLVAAALIAGIVVLLRGLDWRELGRTVAGARMAPLCLAAVLAFVQMFCKAGCWRILLAARPGGGPRVGVWPLFRHTITAFAASAVAPARAGEAVRVLVLKVRHGVAASDATAVALAEKLLDALSMALFVLPLPWLMPGLPAWVGHTIAVLGGACVVAFVVLVILAGRGNSDTWLGRFLGALAVLRRPGPTGRALAVLYLAWLVDFAEVWLVLVAVGIALPWSAGILILLTLNLAIMVPSTPAQVGALELGALVALDQLGVARGPALAFALVYHAMQIIPLLVVGLALDWRLMLGRLPASESAGA